MTSLARKSAQVRRQKAQAGKGQPEVTLEEDGGCATISIHSRNRAGAPRGGSQRAAG